MEKPSGRELYFFNQILQLKKERIAGSDISDDQILMVHSLIERGYLSVDFYDADNNGGYHSLEQYYSLTEVGKLAHAEEWKLRKSPSSRRG
ncbi:MULTISPECIES: hypothetical protein [Pectobacterium]|uniref:hypothetical protein n=1 Tax=Pectobacterium TaxID=122277 RepID=UPI0001A4272B|nr:MULTISPECIES: hypothetical protein [Pectobacterium]AZS56782.1 hypothetical protein C5E18_11930 [Pectobacterium parmentieri]KGA24912.1 hypothetical protein KS44_06260 [Pectobacterium brasiliense]KRF62849.1 hypothetical protein AO825_08290 [Pectobacterium brasiliense]MBI0431685.1 hypothetical protein [Pectobacterium parmentieri]MBN3186058.1 hypothetical protein [Pectobacterium brasiliense]